MKKIQPLSTLKLFLEKQSESWASPVISAKSACSMLPHLSIKRLHSQGQVRGVRYNNSWYFAERDIANIIKREKETIKRINQLLTKQHKKIQRQLYKFIVKLEKCRGQLAGKCPQKLLRHLDNLIEMAYLLAQ